MSLLLKNNIKLLVCDMAGTIINEKNIVYNSLALALEKVGCPANNLQQKSWPGRDKREILQEFILLKNDDIKRHAAILHEAETIFIEELEKKYFQENNISLIDKDNLTYLFDRLRINGVKVALNTGYSKSLQEKLIKHFNLNDKIDDYISSSNVTIGRPYPYMIHRLSERNNIKDMKTVAKIGDTINDMREGKNAGCGLTIGVLTGKNTKTELLNYGDIVIDKITDLL
jgi:phosphonatase-like hydrolase